MDYSKITIIIPTLNESLNIKIIVKMLLRLYPGVHIIVTDDGSDDGTRQIVSRLSKGPSGKVRLLDRSNAKVHGLTASVLDAAMLVKTEYMIVMDADLQHPPKKVKLIAEKLASSDLVIGVRSEVKNWGIYRRVVSKSVSTFCNIVFYMRGKRTSNDIMSGFFGIRSSLFKSIIRRHGHEYVGTGYKVLLDTLKFIGKEAKIEEVPYTGFHERKYNSSKASYRRLIDIMVSALK
ncbi:MAG: glycosyltransferase [Candidatus Marsarchaeota archaeon]|nr:glycosyltransferase [Candidatus Marsarchaeota archaeon]